MNKRSRANRLRSVAFLGIIASVAAFFTLTTVEQGEPLLTGQGSSPGAAVCGDNNIGGSEACDDGNTTDNDGCDSVCAIETGWGCSGSPSICTPICGDGLIKGSETCDDSNTIGGDGCSAGCLTEGCGNNVIDVGETCDPPNLATGCTDRCILSEGSGGGGGGAVGGTGGGGTTGAQSGNFNPTPFDATEATTRRPPPPTCGNGITEPQFGEECDQERWNSVSLCSRWCEWLYCGDGIISPQLREKCEPLRDADGNYYMATCGRGCTTPKEDEDGKLTGGCDVRLLAACKTETQTIVPVTIPSLSPAPQIPAQPSSFVPGIPTAPVGAGSSSSITLIRLPMAQSTSFGNVSLPLPPPPPPQVVCGDHRIEENEECDDGNTLSGDGCSTFCRLEVSAAGKCGDGILQAWEGCDKGARNSDTTADGCRSMCRKAYCGDGVKDANEECDDGNTIMGDGCSTTCVRAMCGNGVLEPSGAEECDEGRRNTDTLPDSCSTRCLMPRCGDAITDPSFGEECDEGENNSDVLLDGCRSTCKKAHCGDGVEDSGEGCDDGNAVNDDGCDNRCASPVCGDGRTQGREKCDDGNRLPSDGCGNMCTIDIPGSPPGWLLLILLITMLTFATTWYLHRRMGV